MSSPEGTGTFVEANSCSPCPAGMYAGARSKTIGIRRLSEDAELGLEWGFAAVFLDPTVDALSYQSHISVGKQLVITKHNVAPELVGAYEIKEVIPYQSQATPGYFVIEYPKRLTDPRSFDGGELVFCLKSERTPDVWSFNTNTKPTPPGPPSAPWAMLASDESMSIKFNPVVDNGGDAISKYQLFMRDAVVKGMYVQVYSDFYSDTIRVGQKQFPGMTENRQFQLKARAINNAGKVKAEEKAFAIMYIT